MHQESDLDKWTERRLVDLCERRLFIFLTVSVVYYILYGKVTSRLRPFSRQTPLFLVDSLIVILMWKQCSAQNAEMEGEGVRERGGAF